ncbi:helix-turn-helix domain-containing protein [Ruegeria profundi]|uniref:helix-turn-helix domain-containing protein n=1 Tax=Ruegeria profundi TaxID=1685378 RepID=UPI003C7DFF42
MDDIAERGLGGNELMSRIAPFSKYRFEWKKRVHATDQLARRTKHFASFVCDEFVSKESGCYWASNATLANRFGVHNRSIQRYLQELEMFGWIRRVRRRDVRRMFQITVPKNSLEHDTHRDTNARRKATTVSCEDDKLVAPYKNIGRNKENVTVATGLGGYLWFSEDDNQILHEWEAFITANTVFDFGSLLQMLRKNDSIALPTRFPKQEEIDRYVRFFSDVVLSKGQSIGVTQS